MQETKVELFKGMRVAGWSSEDIEVMKNVIEETEDCRILSASVDSDYVEVITDDGRKIEMRPRKDDENE